MLIDEPTAALGVRESTQVVKLARMVPAAARQWS
jgi:ABC-type sugar transport system ATPase subunit